MFPYVLFRQSDYKHGFSVMKEETNKEKKVVQPGKTPHN